MLLVPVCTAMWLKLTHLKFAWVGIILTLVTAAVGFADEWTFDHYYERQARTEKGLACIREKRTHEPVKCDELYYTTLDDKLEKADALHVSFQTLLIPTP